MSTRSGSMSKVGWQTPIGILETCSRKRSLRPLNCVINLHSESRNIAQSAKLWTLFDLHEVLTRQDVMAVGKLFAVVAVVFGILLSLYFNQPIPEGLPDDAYQGLRVVGISMKVLGTIVSV